MCQVFTTEWRQVGGRTHKASPQVFPVLVLLLWVCTNRNLKCTFVVMQGEHARTDSPQPTQLIALYCLSHGKEIIPCSHVFNRSSKRKTKTASDMFKNFQKKRAHVCVEVKGMNVFHGQSCVWLCHASCYAHCCCCLSLQVSMFSIPIVDLTLDAQSCLSMCRSSVPDGRASWRLRNVKFVF